LPIIAKKITKKSIDNGCDAAHGTVEDDWQLAQTLSLVGQRVLTTGQCCLQELLGVGDDLRTTEVNRVTQHM